jgi:hypothetical protein
MSFAFPFGRLLGIEKMTNNVFIKVESFRK